MPPEVLAAEPPRLLSVTETAQRLGVSRPMLYKLIGQGECPLTPVKIGSKTKFRSVEVDAFVRGEAA